MGWTSCGLWFVVCGSVVRDGDEEDDGEGGRSNDGG
jgi:hypothetical protein